MNKNDFENTQAALVQAGFTVEDASFSTENFGTWIIVVSTAPRTRVVWDGKDGWLVVETETTRMFAGARVWDEAAIFRDAKDHTGARAVDAVREAQSRPTTAWI
jgi:hypothetical protein